MAAGPSRIIDARRKTVGKPKTDQRSCGTQPAHQSVIYRRLKALPPAMRAAHINDPLRRKRCRIIPSRENLDKRT